MPSGPYCRVFIIDGCIKTTFHRLYANPEQLEASPVLEQQINVFNTLARQHEDAVFAKLKELWDGPVEICDCDTSRDAAILDHEFAERGLAFERWLRWNHFRDHPPLRSALRAILATAGLELVIEW
jgi:hypothetical protein